jgi:hypothetical protein
MYLEEQITQLTEVVSKGFADLARLLQQPQPQTNGAAAAQVQENGPTLDEVIAIAQKLAHAKGPATAAKLIQRHGAAKLAQLSQDKYASFIASAEVLLSESPEVDL